MSVAITPGSGATVAADVIAAAAPPASGQQVQWFKLDVGAAGISAPLSTTNPLPMKLGDGVNQATLAQFHNADNQSLGGTAYGLTVGGVTQIKNAIGNLDRQTETSVDGVPALGITTGAAQFATGFYATDPDNLTIGTKVFTPSAMSGVAGAAKWSIQVGSSLLIDANTFTVTLGTQSSGTFTLTFNNQTTGTIAYNAAAATVATALVALSSIGAAANVVVSGSAGGPYTVTLPSQLTGVLNGITGNFAALTTPANASITNNSEQVVVSAVTGTTFTALTTKAHNGSIAIPFGLWGSVFNQEKDISGETDGSRGAGVASAAEIEYNGGAIFGNANYDRARNLQGKGLTTQTGLTITQWAVSLTLGSNPTNLYPGSQITLGPTAEVVYVDSTYVPGSVTVPLVSPIQNASQTTATWSSFAVAGPQDLPFLPDGEGLEVVALYDKKSGQYVCGQANTAVTQLVSGARTTTQTSAALPNINARGVQVILDVTNAGTGSVTVTIDALDPASGKYYNLLTGAAVTTNTTNVYTVYPGLTASANAVASQVLPRSFRIVVTANNANPVTYSLGYNLIW